jgi:hypothetical protein
MKVSAKDLYAEKQIGLATQDRVVKLTIAREINVPGVAANSALRAQHRKGGIVHCGFIENPFGHASIHQQPHGFDELKALYNRYLVLGAKITLELPPQVGAGKKGVVALGMAPQTSIVGNVALGAQNTLGDFTTGNGEQDAWFTQIKERFPMIRYKYLGGKEGSDRTTFMVSEYNSKSVTGVYKGEYKDELSYAFSDTTAKAHDKDVCWHIYALSHDYEGNANQIDALKTIRVTVEYTVLCYDRKKKPDSIGS